MYINIAKINFKPEGGTSGPRPESITLELNITSTNLDQEFNIGEGYDGYAPVIATPYDVDELFDDVVNVNGEGHSLPPIDPGNNYYDGNVDEEGLKSIRWDDDDIAALKANVWWYSWEDDNYKADKGIWGNKKTKNQTLESLYAVDKNIIGVCKPTNTPASRASSMFSSCTNLLFVPKFNTYGIQNMDLAFSYCTNLKCIPKLDLRTVTTATSMFKACKSLVKTPELNMPNAANVDELFSDCTNLKYLPKINIENATSGYRLFMNCTNLVSIDALYCSNITRANYMFSGCSMLTTIPEIDTSNVNGSMERMFNGCKNLISIPALDTSKVTYMAYMFYNCTSLTSIPALDTSTVTNMNHIFNGCTKLKTIDGIDFSSVTSSTTMFGSSLPSLTRIIVNGSMNRSFTGTAGFTALTNIDYGSVKSILEAANKTTTTTAKTLAFKRTIADPDGELAALVASCITKGWSFTGLTLR